MKRYEGIKREETTIHCPKCNEEIGFADMVCPHCGADARVEKRIYRPRLSSNDIQPAPRERVGGPHKPKENYKFKTITALISTLYLCTIIGSILIAVVSAKQYDSLLIGIIFGIGSAIVLGALVMALDIVLENTALTALNNERIALGLEYQIEQMNELITAYNKDKNIEADNAEVFAKLLVKISKLEEAQKNSTEEIANIVGAISRKLNKAPVGATTPAEEPEFTDDFDDEEAEEKPAEAVENEKEIIEETAEVAEAEEAPVEEIAAEEPVDEKTEDEESHSEEEEEFYTIECPKCGGDIKYTEEQLDNGGADLVCEKCGASIELEVQDEEEETDEAEGAEPERDAQDEYERVFGSDEPISSSSLTSRLEAFLDDEDDD